MIPARGGSKGIPGKNLQAVGGLSLVARSVQAAFASRGVDRVVVSTDDDAIAEEAQSHGAEVVRRPVAIAGDTASSESALLHALDTRLKSPQVAGAQGGHRGMNFVKRARHTAQLPLPHR